MNPGIEIAIIYSDIHLVEIQISASNRAFAGQVTTYVGKEHLAMMAEQLKGFPSEPRDTRHLEVGPLNSFSFSTVDTLGHSLISVKIADESIGPNSLTGKAEFNLLVDPAEIDVFVAQLERMTAEVGQTAFLKGS